MLRRFDPDGTGLATTPCMYTPPIKGVRTLQMIEEITSPPLDQKGKTRIQELVGVLLHYSRVIDSTITTAVKMLSEEQSSPTEDTNKAVQQNIDYCRRYPNNILIFTACDIVLHIQSDASYLSRRNARSVAGGLYYLGNRGKPTAINNPLDVLCQIIDVIVSSAFETEYAALFLNARHSIYLRNILQDLGYPQLPTVILCDNKCAVGIATDTAQANDPKL